MNTRTAVATVALACLNITAIALQSSSDPEQFPAGELLIASPGSNAISAFDEGGGTLPQPVTGLDMPQDMAFAPDGSLFVSDAGSDLVIVTDASGAVRDTIGSGTPLQDPAGLAFGADGSLYVASSGTDSIFVFDRQGVLAGQVGVFDGLQSPWGLAFGPDGRLYVASTGDDSIAIFDPSGTLVGTRDGDGALSAPMGLCFDGRGLLWAACSGNDTVIALDADGEVVATFDGEGELSEPTGLCFGPDGLLYVSCAGNDRIVAFDGDGNVTRVLGQDASAPAPRGIAFAPFTFKATLKGSLQRPGEKSDKFSSKAVVTYAPGSPRWSVRLLDGNDELAQAWNSDTWIFHGLLATPLDASKVSLFGGVQVGVAAAHDGTTALQLGLKGKLELVGGAPALPPRYRLKSGSGDFQRSGPDGIAIGTLKIGSLIKP